MPRLARIVIPGVPHHVVQRGNNLQDVFFVDDDRRFYLNALKDRCDLCGVDILGYCLMSNHIHLLLRPEEENGLGRALGPAHHRFTQYINASHGRVGHLWQGRYFSCALDERHFWRALRYVEQNPVRAGLVDMPWQYAWSSAWAHVKGYDPEHVLNMEWFDRDMTPTDWRQALRERIEGDELKRLRKRWERGWPLAEEAWLTRMEGVLGQPLRPRPVGWQRGRKRRK